GARRALQGEPLLRVDVARRTRDDAPQAGAHHHHQRDARAFGRAARPVGGSIAEDAPPTLGKLGPESLRALAEHFAGLEIVECDHRTHASISASGSCTPSTSRKPTRTARPIATAGESPPLTLTISLKPSSMSTSAMTYGASFRNAGVGALYTV